MPLDAKRFGWSFVFPLWLNILGVAMLAGSFFLFFRSYTDDTFLSPLVRIQEERTQRVVSTGVYFYDKEDRDRGYIISVDRSNNIRQFPPMTISLAAISTDRTKIIHFGRLSEIAAELKKLAKQQSHSAFVVDRRKE